MKVGIFAVGVLAALTPPALADQPEGIQQMRTLGLDAGNAYACTAEDERASFREKSAHLYLHILKDHGPNAAYAYAVSVGYGAARDVATIDCEKLTGYWAGLTEELGL